MKTFHRVMLIAYEECRLLLTTWLSAVLRVTGHYSQFRAREDYSLEHVVGFSSKTSTFLPNQVAERYRFEIVFIGLE